ncbi:MAG TPA: hypothetical protein VIF88_13250 [Methylocystis sp.]|jgi:hypothetical protein
MTKRPADAVPSLSDSEIQMLIERHKIPVSDVTKFGDSLRLDFEIYAKEKSRPNANMVYREIEQLHLAAERGNTEKMVALLGCLMPDTRAHLESRADQLGVPFPAADVLTNSAGCEAICENVGTLCRMGGGWSEGRLRQSGRRSRTWSTLLYAPQKSSHFAKREAERMFVINLQLTWLMATGEKPATTACQERPGPFVRFVQDCLKLAGAGHVNAVKAINGIAQDRKRMNSR